MTIDKPKRPRSHPDRGLDCQMSLEKRIHAAMTEAYEAGWSDHEIVVAVGELANAWYFATAANAQTDADIARAKGLKPS